MYLNRSRRNPRSRCAWLTGPEPRCGYARTSFGIDAAAEVTISKCNLWKSWTLELTLEFFHAHLTIFSTVWDTCWFYQDHASRRNAKLQKISIFCRVKPKSGEKKRNISKNHLSTVFLKSSEKIECAIKEIQWQTKIIECGRIVPPSRWDGPDRLPMEVRSQYDKTYELFLSLRTMKSFHSWSVARKVPVWSWDIVIIEHHA